MLPPRVQNTTSFLYILVREACKALRAIGTPGALLACDSATQGERRVEGLAGAMLDLSSILCTRRLTDARYRL